MTKNVGRPPGTLGRKNARASQPDSALIAALKRLSRSRVQSSSSRVRPPSPVAVAAGALFLGLYSNFRPS